MNQSEKVKYWTDLANEDVAVAQSLYNDRKFLYSGFFCHLAVEKSLKAKIENTGSTPLKIHNLVRLAELGGILDIMSEDHKDLLDALNPLQLEARYPTYKEQLKELLTPDYCADLIKQTKEMIAWIETQL